MRCVQRRACPRPLHLNLFPTSTPPLINYSYTKEAKQTAAANGMGVFVVGEFMGAIHSKDPIKYKKKAKKKGVSRYARPL